MISSLRGKILKVRQGYFDIEVCNVGYSVWVGNRLANKYVEDGEIFLHIHMAVSENDVALYGFESWQDLSIFKMLISVSGVGPKTGAGIVSEVGSEPVIKAIAEADVEFFKKIKGIGLKSAQRIIVDLKSKVGGLGELDLKKDNEVVEDDLFLSLKQLGFDKKEIDKVVLKVPVELVEIEERLSWCLKNLA